jgi:hypothetical protein
MSDQPVSANWYVDPLDPTRSRYWDGLRWTDHVHPAAPSAPSPQPIEAAPGYPAPATAWGAPTQWTPAPATGGLPPAPANAGVHYQPYDSLRTRPRRNVTMVVSGAFSVAIAMLGIVFDLTKTGPAGVTSPLFIAIWTLLGLRGVVWIVRGLRI